MCDFREINHDTKNAYLHLLIWNILSLHYVNRYTK